MFIFPVDEYYRGQDTDSSCVGTKISLPYSFEFCSATRGNSLRNAHSYGGIDCMKFAGL